MSYPKSSQQHLVFAPSLHPSKGKVMFKCCHLLRCEDTCQWQHSQNHSPKFPCSPCLLLLITLSDPGQPVMRQGAKHRAEHRWEFKNRRQWESSEQMFLKNTDKPKLDPAVEKQSHYNMLCLLDPCQNWWITAMQSSVLCARSAPQTNRNPVQWWWELLWAACRPPGTEQPGLQRSSSGEAGQGAWHGASCTAQGAASLPPTAPRGAALPASPRSCLGAKSISYPLLSRVHFWKAAAAQGKRGAQPFTHSLLANTCSKQENVLHIFARQE